MNAFYASVELLSHPELVDAPVAVSGDPEGRHGIILAKNEAAKKRGVVTAETVWQARKKCPNLVLLPAHHEQYAHYSKLINAIYARFTDMVEPFSIDESWLDVTASTKLFGSGEQIAYTIKQAVKDELGLTQSVGVSFNKIFAKMGSEYRKPDAVTLVSRENYKALLWPLPVRELFSVGSATAERLNTMGINTIGDLAAADAPLLKAVLGKQGEILYEYANGLECSAVRSIDEGRMPKSVGNGMTFRRDLLGEADVLTAITALSDTVSGRLRKHGLMCSGVKVDIKDPSFKTISRQMQLKTPTHLADVIRRAAMEILHASWDMNAPIRLLTVTGIDLAGESEIVETQLSFLETDAMAASKAEKSEKIELAMDHIREKYGVSAITYGRIIGNDIGLQTKDRP